MVVKYVYCTFGASSRWVSRADSNAGRRVAIKWAVASGAADASTAAWVITVRSRSDEKDDAGCGVVGKARIRGPRGPNNAESGKEGRELGGSGKTAGGDVVVIIVLVELIVLVVPAAMVQR